MRLFGKRPRARILKVGTVKYGVASGWAIEGIGDNCPGLVVRHGKAYLGGWSIEELDLIANGSK